MAKEIDILRHFRDFPLERTTLGKSLVIMYYTASPPIAGVIAKSEKSKTVVRWFLKPIIQYLEST
jgi:hypothetical protein